MIEKLRKKFILLTLLSVFALLLAILSVINITNFSLVANDADRITQRLVDEGGQFGPGVPNDNTGGGFIPGGPSSPETNASTRYFAYAFDSDGNARKIAYNINAIPEDSALSMAQKLSAVSQTTGWTNKQYRYRVAEKNNETIVVVIDEGRELRPSYYVLYFSIFGSLAGLLITFLILIPVSKKLIKPLEQSDSKQKRFIADAARELKVPITVMYANNETAVQNDEITKSNTRQLQKMQKLVDDLDNLLIFDKIQKVEYENLDVVKITADTLNSYENAFKNKGINLIKEFESPIMFDFNENMLKSMCVEIIENGLKYSKTFFRIKLTAQEKRLTIETFNDCDDVPDGDLDRVFERFYRMQNGINSKIDGNGVGLSIVREIVSLNNGRYAAKGENGVFHLKVEF